jgi:DNA mismatch repair protein MutS2
MSSRKIINRVPESKNHPQASSGADQRYEQAIFAAELGEAPSIDLHQLDRTEAIRETDAFIAREAAKGTEAVAIIHGRGSGSLRQAIRIHLKANPLVVFFRDADSPAQQGGVTYAALHDARKR